MNRSFPLLALVFWLLSATQGCAVQGHGQTFESQTSGAVSLQTIRAFSLGGSPVDVSATGVGGRIADKVIAGQINVLALLPDTAAPKPPIIMVPGFALGANIYLETPDGREGWAMNALRQGYPVYLVDPAHTARAGINPDPFTGTDSAQTTSSTLFSWGREHVWSRWGLGPSYGVPFDNGRFPIESYDNLVRAFTSVELISGTGVSAIDFQTATNVEGLTELLSQTGPAILLIHSAAGVAAFEIARRSSESVLAVVNVEPVGCPTEMLDQYLGVPVLSVFGDHMEVRPQMVGRQSNCQTVVDFLTDQGTPAAMFDLPDMGIAGNSHLMMGESNSAGLMARILAWLGENVRN